MLKRPALDPSKRHCAAAVVCLVAAWAFTVPAMAQRAGATGQTGAAAGPSGQQQTKVIPTIRTIIYDRLNEAQKCMDEDDSACALKILDDVAKVRDLNNYEVAQLWNFRAFLYFDMDNAEGSIEAYEKILALPHEDLPDGLIQTSTRNLATLYLQEERMEEGLKTYLDWMALPTVTPNSDDYYLLSTIYYQMDRYADGVPAVQKAIQIANDKGELGDENWYVLLYVFYFQLEQTDKVIDTLTILVNNWPKRDHLLALAGQMSAKDRDGDTLTLFQAAYEKGLLRNGTEWVQLANLYLNASAPYLAVKVLDKGLSSGTIESTQLNWRLLAQAYQLAQEHEKAIPALERASQLADTGEVDRLMAQSYARLARWDDCATSARKALDRGGLDRPDYVSLQLGQCLVNERKYSEARAAFEVASRDDRSARDARRWLNYIDEEVKRVRANEEALAAVSASNRN